MPRFKWAKPVWATQINNLVFMRLSTGRVLAYSYHGGVAPQMRVFNGENYHFTQGLHNLLGYMDKRARLRVWQTGDNPAQGDGVRRFSFVVAGLQHLVAYGLQRYDMEIWNYNHTCNFWYAPIPYTNPQKWVVAKGVIL